MRALFFIFTILFSGCASTHIVRTQLCVATTKDYKLICGPAEVDAKALRNLNEKSPLGMMFGDDGTAYITTLGD